MIDGSSPSAGRDPDIGIRKNRPVTAHPEPTTAPIDTITITTRAVGGRRAARHATLPRSARGPRPTSSWGRTAVAGTIAVLALATVLLESAVEVLPDEPLVGVLTPSRLALGVGLVAVAVAAFGSRPRRWMTPLDPAVAVLLLAAAAATVVNGQEWSGWRGVLTGVAAFALAVGVLRVVPGSAAGLGLLALVAVGIAGTTAVRQIAHGTSTGFCRGVLDTSADVCGAGAAIRAVGTFANPNLLAAFLVLLLPVATAGVAVLADRWSRLLGAVVIAVGYLAVLFTGSRGGILAAVAGVAAFVVLRHPTPRRLVISGAAVVLGIGGIVVVSRGSVGVRADVWSAAVRLVIDHPLGVGPGRAGTLLDAAVPGDEAFQHAHNMWLNWAVETGFPGLLAVLALTAGAGVVAVRGARAGSLPAVAIGAGLAGFAVMSLADHPANALRISLAMWVVLGALAAQTGQVDRTDRPDQAGTASDPVRAVRSRSGSR